MSSSSVYYPLTSPATPYKPSLLHHIQLPHQGVSFRQKFQLCRITFAASPSRISSKWAATAAAAVADASSAEVDMIQGRDGVWSAKGEQKVVVLWDLDNKPPRGPPYDAAMSLRRLAAHFGDVVDVLAYANRHAFIHLPKWVAEERRERRELDIQERRGLRVPSEPYVCGVCGRKCPTHLDLRKHFRQLHERERNKKLGRMRSLKGKKRQRYRERFISGNTKYEEAAKELIKPKAGYGLAQELRRAGVFVKTVADKPQAADAALKRQMQHSMVRGIDWLFLISDDSDFTDMIRRAREADLQTVVIGDRQTSLGRNADLWVPWAEVESGEVGEEVLQSARWTPVGEQLFSLAVSTSDEDSDLSDLDLIVDEIVIGNTGRGRIGTSTFSDDEETSTDAIDYDNFMLYSSQPTDEDIFWDSDEDGD